MKFISFTFSRRDGSEVEYLRNFESEIIKVNDNVYSVVISLSLDGSSPELLNKRKDDLLKYNPDFYIESFKFF